MERHIGFTAQNLPKQLFALQI